MAVEVFVCREWCAGVEIELLVLRFLKGRTGEVSWNGATVDSECTLLN